MRTFEVSETTGASHRFGREVLCWSDGLVVYESTPHDGGVWSAAKRVELELFGVANGWATPESVAAGEVLDYASFDDRSQMFVAVDTELDVAVGVARLVWGSEFLPLNEQFLVTAQHRIDDQWSVLLNQFGLSRVAEWATLGSAPSQHNLMFALWASLYRVSRAAGVDYWVQSVVEDIFAGYRDMFGCPLIVIGETEVVVGAVSIPTLALLEEIAAGSMGADVAGLRDRVFGGWVNRPRVVDEPLRRFFNPFVRC